MEAIDVMRLPWKKVTDWSELPASKEVFGGEFFVCEADVDAFVRSIYREIAFRANISYNEFKVLSEYVNSLFYYFKERLFVANPSYRKSNRQLIELEKLLKIPDISNLANAEIEQGKNEYVEIFFKRIGQHGL